MVLPFTENFTDTNFTALATHNAGWTQINTSIGNVDIFNNGARKDTTTAGIVGARWDGDTFDADHSAQIKVQNFGSTGSVAVDPGVFIRGSGSGATFKAYVAWRFKTDGKLYLYRCNNSVTPNVAISGGLNTLSAGDLVKLWAVGNQIHLSVNGTEVMGSPFTDSNIGGSSTNPGFLLEAYGNPSIDDFVADNVAASSDPESSLIGGKLTRKPLLLRGGSLIGN